MFSTVSKFSRCAAFMSATAILVLTDHKLFTIAIRVDGDEQAVGLLVSLGKRARSDSEPVGDNKKHKATFNIPQGSYTGEYIGIHGPSILGEQREAHGQGVLELNNGDKYEGEFRSWPTRDVAPNQFHGHGKYTLASGAVYEGHFRDGKFEGEGTFTLKNDDTYLKYQGQFLKYQGQFQDGKFSGQGTMEYTNGHKYTGGWIEGEKSGQGTIEYKSGNKYEGSWKRNKFNGEGTFSWKNGDTYTGLFENGNFNGEGTFTYHNHDTVLEYTGQYQDGERCGHGEMELKK